MAKKIKRYDRTNWAFAYFMYRLKLAHEHFRKQTTTPLLSSSELLDVLLERHLNAFDEELIFGGLIPPSVIQALKSDPVRKLKLRDFCALLDSLWKRKQESSRKIADAIFSEVFPYSASRLGVPQKKNELSLELLVEETLRLIIKSQPVYLYIQENSPVLQNAIPLFIEAAAHLKEINLVVDFSERQADDVVTNEILDENYWSSRRLPKLLAFLSPTLKLTVVDRSELKPNDQYVVFSDDLTPLTDSHPASMIAGSSRFLISKTNIPESTVRVHEIHREKSYMYFATLDKLDKNADLKLTRGDWNNPDLVQAGKHTEKKFARHVFSAYDHQGKKLVEVAKIRFGALGNVASNSRISEFLGNEIQRRRLDRESENTPIYSGDIILQTMFFNRSKASIITDENHGVGGDLVDLVLNHNYLIISLKPEARNFIDPRFLWLQFQYGEIGRLLDEIVVGGRLSVRTLKDLILSELPPIEEQRAIASRHVAIRKKIQSMQRELMDNLGIKSADIG